MNLSRDEISHLIADTPQNYILADYLDNWIGVCAIHAYGLPLSIKQKGIIISVHAHANRREQQDNSPNLD